MELINIAIVVVVLLLLTMLKREGFTGHLWNKLLFRKDMGNRVVLFGTSWCPVCQELKANVWPRLRADLPSLTFEEVDCDTRKDLCRQYGIGSYPTILIMVGDVPVAYSGSWRYEEMVVELRRYA